jgi:uncharacterized protein
MTQFAYLHGLSSSPLGTKAAALREAFRAEGLKLHCPDLNRPSFDRLTFDAALTALDELSAQFPTERWRLVGSSMGGYLAARWAQLNPGRVERLLLLCPGFDLASRWPILLGAAALDTWEREGAFPIPDGTGTPVKVHWGFVTSARSHPPFPDFQCRARIIHGRQDEVVLFSSSKTYAEARPHVDLIEVDDDHRMIASLPSIKKAALEWLPRSDYHWDFFGPERRPTATHFLAHLQEFLARHDRGHLATSVSDPNGHTTVVSCEAPLGDEPMLVQALRPQRKT